MYKRAEDSPLYLVWNSMITRYYNPNHKHFKYYGGLGITVCDRWRGTSFFFLEDMSPTYKSGLFFDRIDPYKGYYKDNCRWSTLLESNRNKRNSIKVETAKGVMSLVEASKVFDICYQTLYARHLNNEKNKESFII